MYEELLAEIGLTRSEIAVYLALLETGPATTGPIIKRAGIASGKAYLILDKLVLKGLVTHTPASGKKRFQAKDPEMLLSYLKEKEAALKEKEKQLQKAIPVLQAKFAERKVAQRVEVFEGVKGFKSFYEWVLQELKKGDTISIMGAPKEANEKFNPYLVDWSKRRIARGIKMNILYNHDSRAFGKVREKMPLTKVRYMKQEFETPAWIDVFKDYVAILNVHGEPVCFLIQNRETAESYRRYFSIMWRQAQK